MCCKLQVYTVEQHVFGQLYWLVGGMVDVREWLLVCFNMLAFVVGFLLIALPGSEVCGELSFLKAVVDVVVWVFEVREQL